MTIHGTIKLSDFQESSHSPDDASRLIQLFCNRVCRAETVELLDEAWRKFDVGDFKGAKKIATKIVKETQRQCIAAYRVLARACRRLGQFDEGIAAFEAQLEYGAEYPELVYAEMANLGDDAGDYTYAVEQATISLDYAKNAEGYKARGWAKFHLGELAAGIQDMRLALRFNPDSIASWYYLGVLAHHRHDTQELARVSR